MTEKDSSPKLSILRRSRLYPPRHATQSPPDTKKHLGIRTSLLTSRQPSPL
jgi:uncharacterized protein (UPF0335 family)